MDIGQFRYFTQGAPFIQVKARPEDSLVITDQILDDMVFFFEEGRELGRSILREPLKRSIRTSLFLSRRTNYRAQKKLFEELEEYVRWFGLSDNHGITLGMILMLLFGMRSCVGEERVVPGDFSTVRCLIHQVITQLLLELAREDRMKLWDSFNAIVPKNFEWRATFCGALSMARLICALNQRSPAVFLPPIFYDFHLSGDLVALSPSGVLFIQVRTTNSGRNFADNRVVAVGEGTEIADDRYSVGTDEKIKLLNGAQRFSEDFGLPTIPVLAEVFLNNGLPWEIHCPALNNEVANFWQSLTHRP